MSQLPGRSVAVPFIPTALAPPDIGAARRELTGGSLRLYLTYIVGSIEALVLFGAGLLGVGFLPLLFLPGFWQDSYTLYAVLATLFTALGLVLPLVWSETIRRAWVARRDNLAEQVAPYNRTIRDPRWAAAQALLLELRGPDPDSAQAELVYRLTRALAEEFSRLERVKVATQAGQSLGDEGAEPLLALREERDGSMGRVLANLKRATAEALRGDGSPHPLLEGLLRDLSSRLQAETELGPRLQAEGSAHSTYLARATLPARPDFGSTDEVPVDFASHTSLARATLPARPDFGSTDEVPVDFASRRRSRDRLEEG